MGLEAMAATARVGFPEMHVTSLEDVEFHAPFKFYRDEPRTVTVRATFEADGDDVLARCAVTGARTLVGRDEPEVTTHFTGTVRLSASEPSVVRERAVPEPDGAVVGADSIYRTYFHGPAYRVLERAWWTEDLVTGRFATDLPPNNEPEDRSTVTTPRLVELAFQTAGLAEIARAERMGLPFGFQRLEILQPAGETAGSAVASTAGDDTFDVDVADTEGRVVLSVRGYRTSALPGRVSLGGLRDGGAVSEEASVHLTWATTGDVPAVQDWLTEKETGVYRALEVSRRAADWRLGRWVAKGAVAAALDRGPADPGAIEVLAGPGGAPVATLVRPSPATPVTVSLSHCGGLGFAAASPGDLKLGCDVEAIEPRSREFVSDYFTADEERWILAAGADRHLRANLLWSAKESTLKALGEGLRMDTRSVEVEAVAASGDDPGAWRPLAVQTPEGRTFPGLWRTEDGAGVDGGCRAPFRLA